MIRRIVFRVLFELQWWWVGYFPGRCLPIGRRGRAMLRDLFRWSTRAPDPRRSFADTVDLFGIRPMVSLAFVFVAVILASFGVWSIAIAFNTVGMVLAVEHLCNSFERRQFRKMLQRHNYGDDAR